MAEQSTHSSKARSSYRQRDLTSCRDQCQHLLSHAFLPKYARIQTLMLLSAACPLADSFTHLDEALVLCNEIQESEGNQPILDYWKAKIERFRTRYSAELDRETAKQMSATGANIPTAPDANMPTAAGPNSSSSNANSSV